MGRPQPDNGGPELSAPSMEEKGGGPHLSPKEAGEHQDPPRP